VTELAKPFAMSLPAVSKHLHALEGAGIVSMAKEGRTYHCHLEPVPLARAAQWIGFYKRLWGRQLDSLTEFLKESKEASA